MIIKSPTILVVSLYFSASRRQGGGWLFLPEPCLHLSSRPLPSHEHLWLLLPPLNSWPSYIQDVCIWLVQLSMSKIDLVISPSFPKPSSHVFLYFSKFLYFYFSDQTRKQGVVPESSILNVVLSILLPQNLPNLLSTFQPHCHCLSRGLEQLVITDIATIES